MKKIFNEFILWWKELTAGYKLFFFVVFFLVILPLMFEFVMNTYYKNNYWAWSYKMENTSFVTEKGDELWFYQVRSCSEVNTEKVDDQNCVKGVKVADLTEVKGRKDEVGYFSINRLSTAILKNKNSFVWSENNEELKSVKIYLSTVDVDSQNVETKLLKEIVKFDLDKYYQDIQKGVALPVSSIQNQTGVIYEGRYKYDPEADTISWVDAMVTEKDNQKPTEAIVRLVVLSLNDSIMIYSEKERKRINMKKFEQNIENLFDQFKNRDGLKWYIFSNQNNVKASFSETTINDVLAVRSVTTWNSIVDYASPNLTISSQENHYIGTECRDFWDTMPCYLWGSTTMTIDSEKTGYHKTFIDGRVVMHKLGNHTTLSDLSVASISQDEEKLLLQVNGKNYFLDMNTGKRNLWTAEIGKIHNFE